MPPVNATILCTRPVDDALMKAAQLKGIGVDVISFIETEPILSTETQQEVEQALTQLATVVFTSMNAVDAVTAILDNDIPDWRIYCMGHTTQQLVESYFGEQAIAGTADNALALADLIIEDDNTDEVIFFCGNQRRNELPDQLEENGISVNEIVVYETIAINHKIKKNYHGILFFSPTAVDSFFAHNKISDNTILFAIGATTANAIKKYSKNKIITGDEPGKDKLLTKAIQYFSA